MKRLYLVIAASVVLLPSIYYSLVIAPIPENLGDVYRSIFFHIPCAWVAVLAFLISCISSALYLSKRNIVSDFIASRSAEIGLLFSVITTIQGSVFAFATWRSAWNWDPRETSIVILIVIYVAYLVLRGLISEQRRRAIISSVYSMIVFLTVPFLVFVVPRITNSLHPEAAGGSGLTGSMWIGFVGMLVGFTLVFILLLDLAVAIDKRNEVLSP
ncbi:MAG TPA: cytochrome c biogenesis protein CcsA [Caldisericia bacterium]|nr:cytochrome c biogenesis protein CcsA [Caldisericia bacterium]HPF49007.1 cytochrome c biogenesis protein CcsA [Caldisericia bacterium]HPI83129.1 cytochrome c biogenesis protein CcsA [Caldisericia bacterium]HPQ92356.1 cytochrome c biogenesis protein CcsA [Caldisericia bacterium]HRV74546.1 cytochrome c biogenesis protein CcsA [Caldisericia bacterium]